MRVTERDFEIMEYLYTRGVATFPELKEKFFKTENACRLRLSRLGKQGFIEGKPLTELKKVSSTSFYQSKSLFSVGEPENLWKVKVYCLGEKLKVQYPGSFALSDPILWKHQLQLTRVQTLLENLLPGALFLTDPQIRESWRQYQMGSPEVIPDLVVESGNLKVAIEVERNLKSELQYYSKFIHYRDSSYTHVVYFCETEKIFRSIVDQSARVSKIGVALILSPKNIFQKSSGYQSLESFLTV